MHSFISGLDDHEIKGSILKIMYIKRCLQTKFLTIHAESIFNSPKHKNTILWNLSWKIFIGYKTKSEAANKFEE